MATHTVDFLDAAPVVGRLMKAVYELWLRATPWAYEAAYRLWFLGPVLCAPLAGVLTLVFGRRIRRWAGGATAVVATYPLASVVLGRLRRRRWHGLPVPTATFVTDFAVHPLWVHRGNDLNLCVHDQAADQAARATGRPARAPGPLVDSRFRTALPDRARAREALGLPAEGRIALVVAGSWGVGELEATFDSLVATGRYLPVAVCGRNERLRRRLAQRKGGIALGWTDAMPTLMAASDVLVQNAGGLTCMEALAAGLPVVTFRPIPGHGRQNALDMERAGVAPLAAGPTGLVAALDRAVAAPVPPGPTLFRGDAATDVSELARSCAPAPLPRTSPVLVRAAAVALAAAAAYSGLNIGADAATAAGLDQAKPVPDARVAYLAVRLGPATPIGPGLARLLARDHVTAVVEGRLAAARPGDVRRLAAAGVTVANGGWRPEEDLHVLAPGDNVTSSAEAITRATGRRPALYVPGPQVSGTDLAFASSLDERIVRGAQVPIRGPRAGSGLHRGGVYVVDAEHATGAQVTRVIATLHLALATRGIIVAPLSSLWPT
ncbi:MAG TPA: glycosyltransferase [Acidimicrobiales bacterium]|nr:glycosyltransferase [Acidimicrobiales bacterium]